MSTNIKKLLASLLAVVLVLSLMPNMVLPAQAADEGNTPSSNVVLPDNGKPTSYYNGEAADTSWYTGDKTEYTLTTAAQLMGLAELSNLTSGAVNFSGVTINFGANMVFNQGDASEWSYDNAPEYSWTPISRRNFYEVGGYLTDQDPNSSTGKVTGSRSEFKGTLNGDGCYISGLYCMMAKECAFIGYATGAKIQNLAIINSFFATTGQFYRYTKAGVYTTAQNNGELLASFVCRNNGSTLENLYSDAYIRSYCKDWHTGGISAIGTNGAIVQNCIYAGELNAVKTNGGNGNRVGGIVGGTDSSYCTVKNCLFAGKLYSDDSVVGGIIGYVKAGSTVSNNLVAGEVLQTDSTRTQQGTVVGQSAGADTIKNNYYCGKTCVGTAGTSTSQSGNASVGFDEMVGTGVLAEGAALAGLGSDWTETNGFPVPSGVKNIFDQHNTQTHVHSYSEEWSYNAYYHWHACTNANGCDGTKESYTLHTYTDIKDQTCDDCGATRYLDVSWYYNDTDGDGKYYISDAADLYGFAALVNNKIEYFEGETVYLTADITVNEGNATDWSDSERAPELEWVPVGVDAAGAFKGTLDGDGHSISGLYLNKGTERAFFLWTTNASIQNLAIVNSYFRQEGPARFGQGLATFVSRAYGAKLTNLYTDAILENRAYSHGTTAEQSTWVTGGIAAFVNGGSGETGNYVYSNIDIGKTVVDSCVFDGTIIDDTFGAGERVGGIAGGDDGKQTLVKNCLFIGKISSNDSCVGGIIGQMSNEASVVENCVSAGEINYVYADHGSGSATKISRWGAVAGYASNASSSVKNCYYLADLKNAPNNFAFKACGTDSKADTSTDIAVTVHQLKGEQVVTDMPNLGYGENGWTAYECDYPVPTGVKAIYEKHVTPDEEHDESGNAADCGNPKVCPDCGDVLDPATGAHEDSNDADFECDVCGQDVVHTDDNLKFDKKGISFQSYIGLQPTILKSLVEGFDKVYVMANGEKIEGFLYQNSVYVFDKMIISTEMTKKITFTVYGEKDGKLYRGEEFTTSLADLALTKIAAFNDAGETGACTVLVDMLVYGAEAQKIYTPDATELATANLGEFADYASTSELNLTKENATAGEGAVVVNEFKLSLQSVLEINLTFAQDMTDYTAKVTMNGETKEYGFEALGENSYVLRIPVGAMLVHEDVVVEVYDSSDVKVSPTYTCSVEAIAKERIEAGVAVDLVTAMMHYCDAVINVFGK